MSHWVESRLEKNRVFLYFSILTEHHVVSPLSLIYPASIQSHEVLFEVVVDQKCLIHKKNSMAEGLYFSQTWALKCFKWCRFCSCLIGHNNNHWYHKPLKTLSNLKCISDKHVAWQINLSLLLIFDHDIIPSKKTTELNIIYGLVP